MQALIAVVLPMLVSALSSVLGKSVSEFNALPRSERPAKLRAVLRSKWMLTSPPAAIAARALAATDAGVNAAVNALEKYGSGAVALGTEAAHAAAEKHLAKNPRSGGRMARVRIAPSIPSYALDRLDVTRARRNGSHVSPDTLTTLNVGDRFVIRDEDSPDRDSLPYTVTHRKFDDVKAEYATGANAALFADGSTVAIRSGGGRTRTVYSIRRVNGARKNGYSRRRNCGGDCACAPCQARSNPDPFAAVRRAIEKEVARFVENGGGFGQSKLMDAAYRAYEKRRVATGEQLPVEAVVAEINAARTRAERLRSAYNTRAMHAAEQAYRDEMRGRSAYMNPATRRNHHIRVGGTFYTPGGRMGTVLAEARGGYYRVRWSDGTMGSVQDSEMAAYPTEGSRARTNGKSDYYAIVVDMAGNEHMVGPMDMRAAQDRVRALESKGMPDGYGGLRPVKRGAGHLRSAQAVMSTALLKYRNPATAKGKIGIGSVVSDDYGTYKVVTLLSGGAFEVVPFPYTGKGAHPPVLVKKGRALRANPGTRSNGTETKYYTYRLYFGKATPRKWAGDFSTREQAQEKADEMIGEYGEPSDGIRIVKFRAKLRANPGTRSNGRKTFRVRFHSAVGQGSRLKQVVERWGGKVGGGGVATFYDADDAEHAMLQAEGWGIAGEVIK